MTASRFLSGRDMVAISSIQVVFSGLQFPSNGGTCSWISLNSKPTLGLSGTDGATGTMFVPGAWRILRALYPLRPFLHWNPEFTLTRVYPCPASRNASLQGSGIIGFLPHTLNPEFLFSGQNSRNPGWWSGPQLLAISAQILLVLPERFLAPRQNRGAILGHTMQCYLHMS